MSADDALDPEQALQRARDEINWPEPQTIEIGGEWFTFAYKPLGDYAVEYSVERRDESRDEWEPYFTGQIKWDGCADFFVGPEEGMYNMHFCSVQQWKNLGNVMEKVYSTASELNLLRDDDLCKGWYE